MKNVLILTAALLLLLGCTGGETAQQSGGNEVPSQNGEDALVSDDSGSDQPDYSDPAYDPIADAKGPLITPEELAKHNTADDCYVRYLDQVYDATPWLPLHPGGADKISIFCGKSDDGFESAFIKKHPGSEFVVKLMQVTDYVGYME